MGQAITLQHVESAPRSRSGLASFNADDQAGQRYLQDVAWAIRYAQLSRLAMLAAVESLLQQLFGVRFDGSSLLHSQHNHVQRETPFDRALWVHRKGAQSARLDEPGIIPGSMGTSSFHVSGRGQPESLCSSSHGAGRRWSRSEARRNITARKLEQAMGHVWFDRRKRSLLRDEAPAAYKDIHAVMRAQRKLTRIVRELRPLLIYKLKL